MILARIPVLLGLWKVFLKPAFLLQNILRVISVTYRSCTPHCVLSLCYFITKRFNFQGSRVVALSFGSAWSDYRHLRDLQHKKMEEDLCAYDIWQHPRTSRPGVPHTCIEIARYHPDLTICLLSWLKEYVYKTQKLRGIETVVHKLCLDRLSSPIRSVVLTRRYSLRIAQEPPLYPKGLQRQSLYKKLWSGLDGVLHKHFANIITSQ